MKSHDSKTKYPDSRSNINSGKGVDGLREENLKVTWNAPLDPDPPLPPNAPLLPPSVRLFRRLLSPRLKRRTRVCWGWYLKECAAVAHFLCAWRAFVALSTAGWLDTIHCLGSDPRSNAVEASGGVNTSLLWCSPGQKERGDPLLPKWKFVFTISRAQFASIRAFKYS